MVGAPLAEEPRPALPAGPSAGGGGGAGHVPGILTPPPWPELEGTATPSQPQPCGRHLGDFCPTFQSHPVGHASSRVEAKDSTILSSPDA